MASTLDSKGVPHPAPRPMSGEEKKVIFASSLGTVFEWYDFYLYGSLAAIIARQFFSGLDAGAAFIFALLAFAAGFLVRPFGAIVFGVTCSALHRRDKAVMAARAAAAAAS